MNWLTPAISIDCGFKLAIALTLFIRYLETKDKVVFWWSIGWLFFGLHNIIELTLLLTNIEWLWFLRHIAYAFTAVAFLESVGNMLKPTPKKWHIISITIGMTAILSSYIGVFVIREWNWAAIPASFINGLGFIACSLFFLKFTKTKKSKASLLIFLGFLLNGIHNLDYPFLRPIAWFAPIGFSLGVLFAVIFAVGLVITTTMELRRQREKSLNAAKNLLILNTISKTVNQSLNLNDIIKNVLDKIIELTNADIAFVILRDERIQKFTLTCYRGFSRNALQILQKSDFKNDSFLLNIFKQKKIKIIHNILKHKTRLKAVFKKENIYSYIAIPLFTEEKITGILNIASRKFHPIDENEMQLYNSIGNDISVAVEKAILYKKVNHLSNTLEKTIEERTKDLINARKATLNMLEDLNESYEELQITQGKLVQSEKLASIGQMAASVSHEIKNPLTGLKMSAYYLSTKIKKSSPGFKNTIENIEKEIAYISEIITDILNYSKILNLNLKLSDINKLIKESVSVFHGNNLHKNVKIIKKFDLSIPKTSIDGIRFNQIINNLLLNACQSMPKGGKIIIKTGVYNNSIEIKISDTGVGIEKDNLNKIFEPFYTSKHRGIGLGLAIVREIVSSHSGNIQVESEPQKGSIFIIKLPVKIK